MRTLSSAKSYVRLFKSDSLHLIITLLMALVGVITCQPQALAQAGAQSTGQNNVQGAALGSLETHFFEHTYVADSPEDRVTRLEKMVFGEAKSGDTAARIADLQKVVKSSETDLTAQSTTNSASQQNSTAGSAATKKAAAPAKSDDDDPALAGTDYPRVDMLEEVIFGQEYKQMSLKKRLVQLETKVFGRPSTDDDLSARTDALEMHWQKTLAAAVQSQYDRDLSWLETQVIGQTYPQKPFIERIQTLEGIVFPNDQQNYHTAMKDQIAALVNAVHLQSQSGHPTAPSVTPIDQGPDSGTAANYAGYNQDSPAASTASRPAPLNPYRTGSSANYASTGVPAYGSGSTGSYSRGSRSYQASPLAQEFAREPSDDSAYNPNYSTPSGYPQPAHSYPGQPAQAAYNTQQQYSAAPVNSAVPTQAQTQEPKQQGHPLLKGLAHALGSAAMVGASMMQNMNLNYGGYGYGSPYGMGGYGMGGYGMPMGYGGMGYGGTPGYGIRF